MTGKNLHPSVVEFKDFLNKHPKLIEEVRKNGRSWQEYYEKWALLGDDDPMWEKYQQQKEEKQEQKSDQKKSDLFKQLMKLTENMDLDKVQSQVQQLNNTIGTLQELVGQFQGSKRGFPNRPNQTHHWFRD